MQISVLSFRAELLPELSDSGGRDSNANRVLSEVDTVKHSYAQFWCRRFRSGNFVIKDASPIPRPGRSIVEHIEILMEIIESNR